MNHADNDGPDQPIAAGVFATTQWSVVLRAKDGSFTALSTLFDRYRKPMIVCLLGKNRTPDQAEDLVQDFCAHLLKKANFLSNVVREKGKFRTFLRTSLEHFVNDKFDQEQALKRGAGSVPVSLNELHPEGEPMYSPESPASSADREYDKAWAETILGNSLHQLEHDYAARGQTDFYLAIIPVMYEDEASPSHREIAKHLGKTEAAVKQAAFRMRKELRKIINDELMQTVSNKAEFEEELAYLITLFGKPPAELSLGR